LENEDGAAAAGPVDGEATTPEAETPKVDPPKADDDAAGSEE